jgi:hypothetical protein
MPSYSSGKTPCFNRMLLHVEQEDPVTKQSPVPKLLSQVTAQLDRYRSRPQTAVSRWRYL